MRSVKVKGVRDLMEQHRFQWKHIAKEMVANNIPGTWDNPQNVYNLVNGNVIPKDAYVYVVFSRMFNTDIAIILSRYSLVNNVSESLPKNVFEIADDGENLF